MTICNRIKKLRANLKLSQQKFSELINVSKGYINDIERGKEPSYHFIQALITFTSIDPGWLLTGEGEMFRPPARPPPTLEVIAKNLAELTEEQRQEILARTGEMLLLNSVRKEVEQLRELIAQKFDKE